MHRLAAGLLVVAINVLRYYDHVGLLGQVHQGVMCGIGLALSDELPAPVVPAPDQVGVCQESPAGGQFLWTVLAPKGVFSTAKSGDAAGGRNSGSRQHRNFCVRSDGAAVCFQGHDTAPC